MRPAFFCAYMRWSAIRSASATSLASAGSSIAPYEQPISKPSPRSDSAAAAATTSGSIGRPAGSSSAQNSSPPMRNACAAALEERGEAAAEADQQRIARRVPERVVVVLEAVEVEEHEHERVGGRRARQLPLEHARERAAVAEAGERVGLRLLARRAQHRDVVGEREHRADHDREERRGGEADGDGIQPREAAVDEQAETAGAEAERHDDPPQPLVGRDDGRGPRRLPGGAADQEQPEPPAGIEPGAGLVGAVRVADEVERVREPERRDAGEQQHPGAVQPPAGAGQGADDHADQDEVAERVGEVGGDLERLARGVLLHGVEDERRAGGGDGERRGDAVGPQRAGHVTRAAAQQRDDAGEHQRREQQVAGVGRRRDRDLVGRPQDRGVVDLAERPCRTAAPISSQARRSRRAGATSPAQTQSAAPASRTTSWANRLNSGPASRSGASTTYACHSTSHAATASQMPRLSACPRVRDRTRGFSFGSFEPRLDDRGRLEPRVSAGTAGCRSRRR